MGDRARHILAIVVVLFCILASTVGFPNLSPYWLALLVRISLLLLAILLLIFVVAPSHQKNIRQTPLRFPTHPVHPSNARFLKARAGAYPLLNAEQAKVFALALSRPNEIRQRIVETYSPAERTIRQRVTIDGQIPHELMMSDPNGGPRLLSTELGTIFFPLLVPPKGKLHDELRIYDDKGHDLSTLSYRESLQLTACILRLLLEIVCAQSEEPGFTAYVSALETQALELIIARLDSDRNLPPDSPTGVLNELNALPVMSPIGITARNSAVALVRKLSKQYVIAVIVRPNRHGRFLIRYEQTIIPDVRLIDQAVGPLRKLMRYARIILGARPVELLIDIENARTCQSYHLEVANTHGLYLLDQTPVDFQDTENARAPEAPTPPHLRFRERLGQPHAHFYARYFPESPVADEKPQVLFRYDEVPPGSLFRAMVAAITGSFVVWVAGVIASSETRPDATAVVILLLVPCIAAGWLGFAAHHRRLLEGTLASRAILGVTAAESLVSSALYLAYDLSPAWRRLPFGISILGVTDIVWIVIMLIQAATATYAIYRYTLRVMQFSYYTAR